MKQPSERKSQVRIESVDLNKDKATVEKIFLTAVGKYNLYDNSDTSTVPQTIKSIVEAKGFGFGFGARVVEDFILVDFFRHKSDSPKFDQVHDFILNEIKNSFGSEPQEIWNDSTNYRESR